MLSIAGNTFFFQWEVKLIEWLQSFCGSFGEKLAGIFSFLCEEYALVFIICLLYLCLNKDLGRHVAVNVLTAVVANPLLKNIALRRRPYMDNASIKCLRPVEQNADIYDIAEQGYSFPSGHSMNSTVVYGTLGLKMKKLFFTIIAIVVPLLVGLSRVVLGVHYPTDVLAGWLVGVLVILLMSWLQTKVKARWKLYAVTAVVSLAGFFYCKSTDYYSAYGLMIGFFCGDLFESRFVNFAKAGNVLDGILRLIGGIAVFLILNRLLKLPFSKEFLDSDGFLSHIVRTLRYAVSVFATIGIFPISFKFFNRHV